MSQAGQVRSHLARQARISVKWVDNFRPYERKFAELALKAVLHYAIFRVACLAIFVATQVERETAWCNIPHNHQVSQHFCCSKRCTKQNQVLLFATIAATLQRIFEALHSVTPLLQLVSQCFVRSANKNTPSTLTSSSEGQVARQVARNIAGCNISRKIAQCNTAFWSQPHRLTRRSSAWRGAF